MDEVHSEAILELLGQRSGKRRFHTKVAVPSHNIASLSYQYTVRLYSIAHSLVSKINDDCSTWQKFVYTTPCVTISIMISLGSHTTLITCVTINMWLRILYTLNNSSPAQIICTCMCMVSDPSWEKGSRIYTRLPKACASVLLLQMNVMLTCSDCTHVRKLCMMLFQLLCCA